MRWLWRVALVAAIIVGIAVFVVKSQEESKRTAERNGVARASAESAPATARLYEINAELAQTPMRWLTTRATLQGADMRAWSEATEADQIATAAEFASQLGRRPATEDGRRVDAFALQGCIEGMQSQEIAEETAWETARVCAQHMNWLE